MSAANLNDFFVKAIELELCELEGPEDIRGDLWAIYQAPTREATESRLLEVAEQWNSNYPVALRCGKQIGKTLPRCSHMGRKSDG